MILASQCFIESFWIAEQWIFDNGGHLLILQTPSSHTHSWTFNLWKVKINASSSIIPLDSPTWTFELVNPLDIALILGREKFTRSCLCESPFDLRAMLALSFVDPKFFWPSKWSILLMKEDPLVCLATTLAICDESLDWLVHCSLNSSLPRPSPHIPLFKYTL